MVEIADIEDKDSLRAWLENQPREVSVWIAFRAAARALPVWWGGVLSEEWAQQLDLTSLAVLHALLVSAVASRDTRTNQLKIAHAAHAARARTFDEAATTRGTIASVAVRASRAALMSAFAVRTMPSREGRAHTGDAVEYAASAAADAAARSAVADIDAKAAFDATDELVWKSVRTDATKASQGQLPDALSLWHDVQNPFEKDWTDIKAQVAASPDAADWQFWIDWYDAQLAGRTMLRDPVRTWDMLEEIALIDPETWDAGPDVVNPKIREIWELYRLRVEVAALQAEKEAFLAARASHAQRSHNQPPEGLVDDQPEVARQITIVWDSLDDARDELEEDTPDKGKLRHIADRLLSALTTILKYSSKLADAAAMATAKKLGPPGAIALVDHLANNGRLMQFAKDLLTYGGG